MKAYRCSIRCPCGGVVDRLVEEAFYTVTENNTIIFGGACNKCGNFVQVERALLSLIVLKPTESAN